jgi:hypothetical protein
MIDLTMAPCHHSLLEPPGLRVKVALSRQQRAQATINKEATINNMQQQ